MEKVVGGKKEKDTLERRVENESGDHPTTQDQQSNLGYRVSLLSYTSTSNPRLLPTNLTCISS